MSPPMPPCGETAIESMSAGSVARLALESALRERGRREGVYDAFKWFGRRFASMIRGLIASSVLESGAEDLTLQAARTPIPSDVFEASRGRKLLDAYSGSGIAAIEAARLGFTSLGVDIDPAAYYTAAATWRLASCKCEAIASCLIKALYSAWRQARKLWCTSGECIIHILAAKCPPCTAPVWVYSRRVGGLKVYGVIGEDGEIVELREAPSLKPSEPRISLNRETLPEIAPGFYAYAAEVYDESSGERRWVSLISGASRAAELREFIKESAAEAEREFNGIELNEIAVPHGRETRKLLRAGITSIARIATRRQLVSLYRFVEASGPECRVEAALIVASALRSSSLLAFYYQPSGRVNPGLVVKSYWIPLNPVELNPLAGLYRGGVVKPLGRGGVAGYVRKYARLCSSCSQAPRGHALFILGDLSRIYLRRAFDVVVADPPYPTGFRYSELLLLHRQALAMAGLRYEPIKGLYVDGLRTVKEYIRGVRPSFVKSLRALRDRGTLILIFGLSGGESVEALAGLASIAASTGVAPTALYPFLGEAPGSLGRGRSRLVAVMVGRKGCTGQDLKVVKPSSVLGPDFKGFDGLVADLAERLQSLSGNR